MAIIGTKRFTQQGFLQPEAQQIRLFNVHFVSTDSETNMVFSNRASGTTATGAFTDYLTVRSSGGIGNWDGHEGMLFPDGVFFETSAGFSYAIVTYITQL